MVPKKCSCNSKEIRKTVEAKIYQISGQIYNLNKNIKLYVKKLCGQCLISHRLRRQFIPFEVKKQAL